jgi:hypothetical protein
MIKIRILWWKDYPGLSEWALNSIRCIKKKDTERDLMYIEDVLWSECFCCISHKIMAKNLVTNMMGLDWLFEVIEKAEPFLSLFSIAITT